MFDIRLDEIPLPASERDLDTLVSWLIDTLCLHRRRGESTADGGRFSPIHRILKDHLIPNPTIGINSKDLSDEMALTPAAIHHHLTRLTSGGLVSSSGGNSWRLHHLCGGNLLKAVDTMSQRSKLIQKQRMEYIEQAWQRGNDIIMEMELAPDPMPALNLRVKEWSPISSSECELSRFMADFGLLGERPGKEISPDSISVKLFEMLLNSGPPISIDEAAKSLAAPKPRIGRILERFRATGLVERVARTDRLATALWSAMNTQYLRRGEDWMLKRGGFERLDAPNSIFKKLKKGNLTAEFVKSEFKQIPAQEQMLLLNLLGGRLALGYRLVGDSPQSTIRKSQENLDRILQRIRRVATIIEQS
jgi:DNA-binding MarR family transcriptional regulator